nr:amidohydrolase family protein [Puniceibacterium sp. IMCC21224]
MPEFVLTGQRVFRQGGRLALADGTLAGADLDLPQALRNLIGLGVPLDNALAMATAAPAAAIGRTDLGHIKVGGGADLVHLDDHMALQAVWQGGTSLRLG